MDLPLGVFTCVTGISGSGKSSLISQFLVDTVGDELGQREEAGDDADGLEAPVETLGGDITGGLEEVKRLVVVDQKPIGRTPRSNLATYTGAQESPVEVLHLYFPSQYLDRLVSRSGTGENIELRDHLDLRDHSLQFLAREIDSALDDGNASRLYIEGIASAIAARLLSAHTTGKPLFPERGGLAPWQLKRSCDAMVAKLDADIGLKELAAIAGCSPTHFSRAFKRATGLPPFQWLNERRIERAKALLMDAKYPLAEIALNVGFSAQPQFTTAFRRLVGMTPGAWRREYLR